MERNLLEEQKRGRGSVELRQFVTNIPLQNKSLQRPFATGTFHCRPLVFYLLFKYYNYLIIYYLFSLLFYLKHNNRNYSYYSHFFFFSFRLSLFGVATARLLSPHPSVNHILLHNTHTLHILPHHIQPPLPRPSPFPSSRHLHLQCPSPYILRFSPFHMSIPPQPCSCNLLPQLSYSRRPSDILIPDLIFSCHPQRPPDHLQFCHLQLPHLLVRHRHCLHPIHYRRSNYTLVHLSLHPCRQLSIAQHT